MRARTLLAGIVLALACVGVTGAQVSARVRGACLFLSSRVEPLTPQTLSPEPVVHHAARMKKKSRR
jgi:hypothetical protein